DSGLVSVGVSGPYLARLLGGWRAAGPAYVALARALRLLILDGRLPLRTRLPGERELAEALGVSRTTASAAYAALRAEGFLASRHRRALHPPRRADDARPDRGHRRRAARAEPHPARVRRTRRPRAGRSPHVSGGARRAPRHRRAPGARAADARRLGRRAAGGH